MPAWSASSTAAARASSAAAFHRCIVFIAVLLCASTAFAQIATFQETNWADVFAQKTGIGNTIAFSGSKNGTTCTGTMTVKPPDSFNVAGPLNAGDDSPVVISPAADFTLSWESSCVTPPGSDPKNPPTYSFQTSLFLSTNDYGASDCLWEPQLGTVGPGQHTFKRSGTCSVSAIDYRQALGEDLLSGYNTGYVTRVEFGAAMVISGDYMPLVVGYIYHKLPARSVTSVDPAWASNVAGFGTDSVPLTIEGNGFAQGAKVRLTSDTWSDIELSDVVVVDEKKITATLKSATTPPLYRPGVRSVLVTNPDASTVTGKDLFTITDVLPRIEINQGVPMYCTIRPCIADHDTWVRVRVSLANGGLWQRATGRLHVMRNGAVVPGSPFKPQPGSMMLKHVSEDEYDVQRLASAGDALNFRFDESTVDMDEGIYDFRFELDPKDPAVEPAGIASRTRYLTRELNGQVFRRSNAESAFRLSFMLDLTPTEQRIRPVDYADLANYVRASYPISRDLVKVRLSPTPLAFSQFGGFKQALQAVSKRGTAESKYLTTYTIMVTSDTKLDAAGSDCHASGEKFVCEGPGSVVRAEEATTQAVVAHELGHHLLLGDTYFSTEDPGSEQRSPANPPSNDCRLLGNGCPVDAGNLDTLLGTVSVKMVPEQADGYVKRDTMGNANRPDRWIDSRTWDYLYPKFNSAYSARPPAVDALAEPAAEPSFVRLSGSIDRSGHVSLDPAARVVADDANGDSGDYVAELRDGGGTVLTSQQFSVSFAIPHTTKQSDLALFGVTLPLNAAAKRVVIRHGDSEAASLAVSANPPVVKVLSPNGGETLGAAPTIRWEGSDPDGDTLSYTLLYSTDGTTWDTIEAGLTGTQYTWDTTLATGSRSAQVMVVASDGWNESSDTSDAVFRMLGKPPWLQFDSPVSERVGATVGQPITFAARAWDLEDGTIASSAISYSSNLQGPLGAGAAVTVANLQLGTHTITAAATDKDGTTGTASIVVVVTEHLPKLRSVRH